MSLVRKQMDGGTPSSSINIKIEPIETEMVF